MLPVKPLDKRLDFRLIRGQHDWARAQEPAILDFVCVRIFIKLNSWLRRLGPSWLLLLLSFRRFNLAKELDVATEDLRLVGTLHLLLLMWGLKDFMAARVIGGLGHLVGFLDRVPPRDLRCQLNLVYCYILHGYILVDNARRRRLLVARCIYVTACQTRGTLRKKVDVLTKP